MDEYIFENLKMPLLIITTSHRPSQRTRSFVKDLANTLPSSIKLNRGKKTLFDLGFEAYRNNALYIMIICEKRGNPSLIRVYKLEKTSYYPKIKHIASIKISGVKLTRENPESTRIYNPETIWVKYENCRSDNCFKLADIIVMIYKNRLKKEKADIIFKLEDKDNITIFIPLNALGRICGPILKVSGVKIL